jgi:NACHT domain
VELGVVFAGVQVDIRSDLYSLGATLWKMLTGQAPFRGTSAELMHRHLHAPLPLDLLEAVPQPVVILVEVLLDKDPSRRFQNPAELLKAMPAIRGAIEARRRITRQSLQKTPSRDSRVGIRKPPGRVTPKKISVASLPVTGSDVFGREEDIAFLDDAWTNQDVNVVTIAAWAGVGKSTLVNHWLRRMATDQYRSAELVFGWSFYRQGTSGGSSSADEFLDAALDWFGDADPRLGTAWEKGERLAKLVAHRRTLLLLDGLEPLQNPPGPHEGRLREPSLQALLRELAAFNKGLCVITTRTLVADLADHERTSTLHRDLEQLSSDAGAKLLQALIGQWRYSLQTDKLTATMQVAKRVYSLAQEQDDPALMIGACQALACTLCFLGDFETAQRYAMRGVQIWRSGGLQPAVEEVSAPVVMCLCWEALSKSLLGEIASSRPTMAEAISLAQELNDMYGLAVALNCAAVLAHMERNVADVERRSSDLIELSTRHHYAQWLAIGSILRGWARSASGETSDGISWIEDGTRNYRATGAVLAMPFYLALKAEALYLADRISEALEVLNEAEALAERFEQRWWSAELHRLRGVFLTAMGAAEPKIEASDADFGSN